MMPSLGVHLDAERVAPLRGSGDSRAARTRPGRLADIGPVLGNRASPSDGARVAPGRSGAGGRGVARDFLGCACRTVTVIALPYTGVSGPARKAAPWAGTIRLATPSTLVLARRNAPGSPSGDRSPPSDRDLHRCVTAAMPPGVAASSVRSSGR